MTTSQRKARIPRSPDAQQIILKLERTIRNLCTLRQNLNSYSCEPKTQGLFEAKVTLSRDLEQMTKKSAAVLYDMRVADDPLDDPILYLKDLQRQFQELEQQVLEYIGRARFLA